MPLCIAHASCEVDALQSLTEIRFISLDLTKSNSLIAIKFNATERTKPWTLKILKK